MATKKDTTIQIQEQKPIQGEAEILISQAISQNIPVESLERLLVMRRELRAEKAKEAYDRAMADFQAECPIIERTKQGYNYKYAPLEVIVEQAKPFLTKHGFSYTFDTDEAENAVMVFCNVKHIAGHMETSKAKIAKETTTKMNASQQSGSSMTYGKRYSFINAFGIVVKDEDNDAATIPHSQPEHAQNTPQNAPKQVSTTDSILNSCPQCGGEMQEKSGVKKETGKPWTGLFCQNPNCRYIKWGKVITPQQTNIEDESQFIPNPEE